MTDRELLESAAGAAGYKAFRPMSSWAKEYGVTEDEPPFGWLPWNPLTDDGDALRLAVKLRIETHFFEGGSVDAVYCDESGNEFTLASETSTDMLAATRRCIVRAAASLGSDTGETK